MLWYVLTDFLNVFVRMILMKFCVINLKILVDGGVLEST